MSKKGRFSHEVRERAVRMVAEHRAEYESEWAALTSLAEQVGCAPESLRKWVRQAQREAGEQAEITPDERARLRQLEKENRELKRANEILRKASAFFAQAELDRQVK